MGRRWQGPYQVPRVSLTVLMRLQQWTPAYMVPGTATAGFVGSAARLIQQSLKLLYDPVGCILVARRVSEGILDISSQVTLQLDLFLSDAPLNQLRLYTRVC